MRHALHLMGILFGLAALLLCVNTPVQAATPMDSMPMAHSQMPCCPDRPAPSVKACAAQCPVVVSDRFVLAYVPVVTMARFETFVVAGNGLSYEPLAPPPR